MVETEMVDEEPKNPFAHDRVVKFPVEIEAGRLVVVDARNNPWRRSIALIALLLFVISTLGWIVAQRNVSDVSSAQTQLETQQHVLEMQTRTIAKQQDQIDTFATALRRAAVRGCYRQNKVRGAIRDLAHLANQGLRAVSPGTAPNAATEVVIERRQELRQHVQPAPCDNVYPQPK